MSLSRVLYGLLSVACMLQSQGCGGGAKTEPNPPPQANVPDNIAPTAPTGLNASAINANRIDLSWAASTDANGIASYQIFRDGSASAIGAAATTNYSDTSLSPSTRYRYTVRATDTAGNVSEPSAEAGATTLAAPAPGSSGLDSRPSNATCAAWPRSNTGATIRLERFTSLSFSSPIGLLQAPADNVRWYVVQQNGLVQRFAGSNPSSATTVIDLRSRVRTGGEMGLLGMAFHPQFPSDNRVFLSYTTGTPLVSRISSFTSSDAGATLNAASEQILLTIDQPQENHNGGHIAFGPDGYLYIGIGDGGGSNDQHGDIGNGQRLTTMLGKLLRIDVRGVSGYTIPGTNPFAQNAPCPAAGRSSGACPEIYAYGLRNPWRWSFDRESGELWLADVGQNRYEEVNRVTLGGNYGWRCREGAHDFASGSTSGCSASTLIDPVTEYDHDVGESITGGFVYRGSQSTSLVGRYVFGDFGSGRIFAWIPDNTSTREPTELLESGLNISSFGQGNDGEHYVVHYGGTLHRIVFSSSGQPTSAPNLLSDTGCVSSSDASQPASGLISYSVNAPFWSDGADKERWIALPDAEDVSVASDGDWDLPNGTVLMKHFRTGDRLIETRLLMRHPDGVWGGFTYEWNAQQTDAARVPGGAEREIGLSEPWIFPSEAQCLECHTSAGGRSLGLETAQLNRDHTYAVTSRTANQLTTLSHVGVLTPPISDASTQPVLVDPNDTSAPLNDRARAYLHTNCSFCHRPGGPTPSTMDLRYSTALNATNTCNANASDDLGIGANARILAPGSATNSVLVGRMNRRDEYAMPPLGSNQIDAAGVALISEWIGSLSGC